MTGEPSIPGDGPRPSGRSLVALGGWAVAIALVGYLVYSHGLQDRPRPVPEVASQALPSASPATSGLDAPVPATSPAVPLPASPPEPVEAREPIAPPSPSSLSLEEMIAEVIPAVVVVETPSGTGSGFFVPGGGVLTSAHVVTGQSFVRLKLASGTSVAARVAMLDSQADLALLRVGTTSASHGTVRLGTIRSARVGQPVVVIGSPLGAFANTVTRGIVSAFRVMNGVTYVQTDAAINPGNSGGPVVSESGEVLGVATSKVMGGESIAFAVAVDYANQMLGGTPPGPPPPGAVGSGLVGVAPPVLPEKSEMDLRREQGAEDFERAMQALAQAADRVDATWAKYSAGCARSGPRGADRPWFGLWDNPTSVLDLSVPKCQALLEGVEDYVNRIRAGVNQAHAAARRAGVYPGVQTAIRRKYRMEWNGWNR